MKDSINIISAAVIIYTILAIGIGILLFTVLGLSSFLLWDWLITSTVAGYVVRLSLCIALVPGTIMMIMEPKELNGFTD